MTKKHILIGVSAFLALPLMAKTISPDQALARLHQDSKGNRVASAQPLSLAHTALTESGDAAVYVFNRGQNAGYLLVSADDMAIPMLGYADQGAFSAEAMPPAMEWWMSEYARRIESANQNAPGAGAKSKFTFAPAHLGDAIAPQIQTRWDQIEPYNNKAPLYGANRTYTGCVATAMAQVMNYWQYPAKGKGTISYTASSIEKKLTLDFSRRAFDWANMLKRYEEGGYTDTQADAVAYLMQACGYSVKSDYSTDATGALAMNIRQGLVKYFDYDPNTLYVVRACYTTPEWEKMMYDNLKNVGPILYGGSSYLGGGHSFVCDGYDGNGYFHFNWGWSGISNGYFALDALNPDALGSGGGSGGGYNFTQDAVLGIQPPTGDPVIEQPVLLTQMGSLKATVNRSTLTFALEGDADGSWVNYNPETIYAKFGMMFDPVSDGASAKQAFPITDLDIEIKAAYGTGPQNFNPSLNLADADLADGTYKVSAVVRDYRDDASEWKPVRPIVGNYDYFFLTKSGSKYTVQNQDLNELTIVDGSIVGTLYADALCKVTITVKNDNDMELTKGFAPMFFMLYGEPAQPVALYLGQSVFMSVPPHSTATKEWVTDLTPLQNFSPSEDMDLLLTFFDEATFNILSEQCLKVVTMKPYPTTANVFVSEPMKIPGAPVVTETVAGMELPVTLVDDKFDIPVTCSLRKSGRAPFAFNVLACVVQPDFEAQGAQQVEILTYGSSPVFIETSTEIKEYKSTVIFPQGKPGIYYSIMLTYFRNGYNPINTPALLFRINSTSGIDSAVIDPDVDENAPYYNLQGICLGTDWDSLPAGLYIRAGKKIAKNY